MMHVAVIPDGNRRWAQKNGLDLERGYEMGIRRFAEFVKWSIELGVDEITGWGMSYDNYIRRDREVLESIKRVIMRYYEENQDRKEEIFRTYPELNDINLKVYGFFDDLDPKDRELIDRINSQLNGKKYRVNILVLYNGRMEILKIARDLRGKESISMEDVINSLMIRSYPDIVIRTGGHVRTSGFMPIQTEYSEWFFLDKLWPEFTRDDYVRILEDFRKRNRNFGR